MEDREFGEKLFADGGDSVEKVERPAKLRKLFNESDITDLQKKKYAELCERLQDEYIKSENFFRTLEQESSDPSRKAVFLMQLCGRDGFIEGPNLDTARKLIGHYIMQPEFLPRYLGDTKTKDERNTKVEDLKRYLLEAGIKEDFGAKK